ncbi:MAG TPA: hypothetical protein VK970_20585, partial [Candidatus Methylacidiphilales bacterium]|nr:hypothetical protein [Candidatus Methylacidiphilales bacterium]
MADSFEIHPSDSPVSSQHQKPAARVLVLRTSGRYMTGYGGFPWPWRGPVSAPEVWNPAWGDQPDDWVGGFRRSAKRGGGLHGFENGEGEWGLLSWDTQAKALIIETDESRIVRDKRTDASRRRILAGASGAPAAPGDGGPVRFSSGDVVDVTSLPAALCRLVCNPERVLAGILALTATDENCSGKRIAATMRTALASTDRDETLAATASLCQLASAGQR